jgi:hypothetical protein
MPRQARLDTPGTLHHVIIRGIEKRPIVDDVKDKKEFVFRMGNLSTEEKTTIYAWTLMSNHCPYPSAKRPLWVIKIYEKIFDRLYHLL